MEHAEHAWCYLYVRRALMSQVSEALGHEFSTYIHTNIVYKREPKAVRSERRPTIPGLLFVHGEPKAVQALLSQRFVGVYLAKDCSTGRVAVIRDSVMQAFKRTASIEPTRIRFLQHPLDYYADGHHLVRITSGILAGFEGYCVRIARDRCIVTSLGGITISIGGVNRETFEDI